MSKNVNIIESWYKAPSKDFLTSDSEWILAEGFPAGGRYIGPNAVFDEFFPQLLSQFSKWEARPSELLDAGSHVVALGHYHGWIKGTETKVVAPFAHVWKLSDGKISQARQYVDTVLIARELNRVTT
jgi:uncharacterized protein